MWLLVCLSWGNTLTSLKTWFQSLIFPIKRMPFSTSIPQKAPTAVPSCQGRGPSCRAPPAGPGNGRRSPCGESRAAVGRPGEGNGTASGAFSHRSPGRGAQGGRGAGPRLQRRGRHGDASGPAGPRFLPVRHHYCPAGNSWPS